jgi:ribosomal protein S18 acetylase RimI-like enzyme
MDMRLLSKSDSVLWKTIRLEALLNYPENYLSSYEEERLRSEKQWEEVIEQNKIYGLFVDGQLVSTVSLSPKTAFKHQHKGEIWGIYTKPAFQGRGFAYQLLAYVLEQAQKYLELCYLTCTTTNQVAFGIYQKIGFVTYGVELKSIYVNKQYYDEYLMAIDFSKY